MYPSLSSTNADFAFGIATDELWSSVGAIGSSFKWYAGGSNIATLSGSGDLTVTGNLVVNGSMSVPSVTPYHCAGLVSATGTILRSKGLYTFTVVKSATGVYDITFGSAHPDGTSYIVTTDAYSDSAWGTYVDSHFQRTSSTVVRVSTRNTGSGAKVDNEFTFCVLA